MSRLDRLRFAVRPILLVLFATAIALAPGANAESGPLAERRVHEISGSVLSPFCPGRSLNDCPSSQAGELKNEIRSMVEAGRSDAQIYEALFARYGESIRATPEARGWGLLAWLSPFVFLGAGFLILMFWLRGRRQDQQLLHAAVKQPHERDPLRAPAPPQTALDEDLSRAIDEELRRADEG